jgi:uncharacterized protein (TIGR01777 family)
MDFQFQKPKRVLLSGASGMLGSAIERTLQSQGTETLRLTRGEPKSAHELRWNPSAPGGDLDAVRLKELEGMSAAIHLSGANVSSRRWSASYKLEMQESRVTTTRTLSEALARLKTPPSVLASASAVGFYGNRGDAILDEDSAPGSGYFPHLCEEWEAAAQPSADAGIRVVHPRFGIVLGPDGGALARLVPMFKMGAGGKLGNGRQWMSWISEADAVASVLFAVENSAITGAFNAVAPEPVTNAEFTRQLGHALHRPTIMTAPAFALRLAFGEMADEALLSSTRAIPVRLPAAGFRFRHPDLRSALAAALAEM